MACLQIVLKWCVLWPVVAARLAQAVERRVPSPCGRGLEPWCLFLILQCEWLEHMAARHVINMDTVGLEPGAFGVRGGFDATLDGLSPPKPRGGGTLHYDVMLKVYEHDSLAERSKAVAQGAIPQGRGLEPHSCQREHLGEKQAGPQRRLTAPPSNLQSYGIIQPLSSKCPQLMAQNDDTQNLPAAQGRLGKPRMARMGELPAMAQATNMAGLHDAATPHARQCDTLVEGAFARVADHLWGVGAPTFGCPGWAPFSAREHAP